MYVKGVRVGGKLALSRGWSSERDSLSVTTFEDAPPFSIFPQRRQYRRTPQRTHGARTAVGVPLGHARARADRFQARPRCLPVFPPREDLDGGERGASVLHEDGAFFARSVCANPAPDP